ncbi:MAG: phosphotransferase [Roseovarius sp.]
MLHLTHATSRRSTLSCVPTVSPYARAIAAFHSQLWASVFHLDDVTNMSSKSYVLTVKFPEVMRVNAKTRNFSVLSMNMIEQADRLADQARVGFHRARVLQRDIRKKIRLETGMSDWETLRKWSRLISGDQLSSSPERFATLVARHDPGLALEDLHDAWIIGGGGGDFNLNAYRCGTLNGVPVFEKIYLLHSEGWRRVNWAYSRILPRLEGRVRAPRLLHRRKGRRLAAAYFEYLPDLTQSSNDAIFDAVREFQQHVADLDMSGLEPMLADFRAEPNFLRGAARLRKILTAAGRDPDEVDTVAASLTSPDTRRIFTHGDLVPANIAADGVIFDWDRCGAYPPGYEIGSAIGRFVYCDTLADFDAIIKEKKFARTCVESPGSLEFFTAVYYARRSGVEVKDSFILALFDRAMELRGILSPRDAWLSA